MIRIRHIEINARNMSEIAAVLVPLKQEMPPILVVRRGTTGIVIKNKVRVFIRLGATAIA
jgi:hypothetical protein